MTRFLRLLLLAFALFGLVGESTAMAMAPPAGATMPIKASMADMDCRDMAPAAMPDGVPCKKITWQCIATMGCVTAAALEPVAPTARLRLGAGTSHGSSDTAPLFGRSYGPEPDPPAFLI